MHRKTEQAYPQYAAHLRLSVAHIGVVLMMTLASPSWGQQPFQPCGTGICYASGNVGIGTTSPSPTAMLDVNGSTIIRGQLAFHNSPSNQIFIQPSDDLNPTYGSMYASNAANSAVMWALYKGGGAYFGSNVGIGTMNPSVRLHLMAPNRQFSSVLAFDTPSTGQQAAALFNSNGVSKWQIGKNTDDSFFVFDSIGRSVLVAYPAGNLSLMPSGGNVGIGTTDPCDPGHAAPANCKLSVAGAIQAQEVVVNTGWSDYVFEPNYRLRPLTEVAAYVRANHHLPDVPSESEVREKGISVGEMQSKLLAKIEELTLHMIAADEQIHSLKEQNHRLELKVGSLDGRQK